MTSLADVFVTGRIDTKQFGPDIKKGLSGSASTMSTAGKESGSKFKSGFGSSLRGIAAPLTAAFSVVAVGTFLKGAIGEAQQAAKVGAQTATVLKSTRGEAGLTAQAIGDLANELSKKAGVDDETIQSGENVLLTFTKIRDEVGKGNDIFSQATGVALDMSKALGTDLQGSVIQVGKALNDPIKGITALQRVGVSFTQQQRDQIAAMVESGDTLSAQKTILAELTKEFGGSAAAQATASDHLKVAYDNLKESIGQQLMPVLNDLANFLTEKGIPALLDAGDVIKSDVVPPVKLVAGVVGDAAHAFNELPGPVREAAKALGIAVLAVKAMRSVAGTSFGQSVSRGVGQAALSYASLATKVTAAEGATRKFGAVAKGAASGGISALSRAGGGLMGALGGPWGIAIAGGITALGLFASKHAAAAADVEALKVTLDAQTGAITKNSYEWAASKLADKGLVDDIARLGLNAGDVTKAMLGNKDAVKAVNAVLDGAIKNTVHYGGATDDLTGKQIELSNAAKVLQGVLGDSNGTLDEAQAKTKFVTAATKQWKSALGDTALTAKDLAKVAPTVTSSARELGGAVSDTAGEFAGETKEVKATKEALEGYRSVAASLISKQLGLSQAILDAKTALKDHKDGFDKDTKAGIDNYQVILDLAAATDGFTAKTARGRDAIDKARAAIVAYASAQGKSIPSAKALADRLLGIADAGSKIEHQPATLHVHADTQGASRALDAFMAKFVLINGRKVSTTVETVFTHSGVQPPGGASGGLLRGPGGPRDDKIPAMLSNGEFIVNAAATSRNLGLLHQINAQHFAGGGAVSAADQRAAEHALAQATRALEKEIKHFNVRPGDTASDTRSLVDGLTSALRDVVGKDSPLLKHFRNLGDTLVNVQRSQDKMSARYDTASGKLKATLAARHQYATSVATAFTHDAFGGSLADLKLQLRADTNDARRANRGLDRARRMGLSGAALRQLAASGNTLLIDQVSHLGKPGIRGLEDMLAARTRATSTLGGENAQAVFGNQVHEQTKELHQLGERLRELNHSIDQMEHRVERGARKGVGDREHRASTKRRAN